MIASLLIVFREILRLGSLSALRLPPPSACEAAGPGRQAVFASESLVRCLLATIAGTLSGGLAGAGQEVLTVSILVVAVLMLRWHQLRVAGHGRLAAGMAGQAAAVLGGADLKPRGCSPGTVSLAERFVA
jgi:high-affinity iron transporter